MQENEKLFQKRKISRQPPRVYFGGGDGDGNALFHYIRRLFVNFDVRFRFLAGGRCQGAVKAAARKGMESMMLDLRQTRAAKTDVPTDGSSRNRITFQLPTNVSGGNIVWGPNITYALGGSTLVRTPQVGQPKNIATNITSLSISRQTPSIANFITIVMTAGKNTLRGRSLTDTIRFNVQLRN